ncbi:unnamed protein product, partial [Sphagnum compactum]
KPKLFEQNSNQNFKLRTDNSFSQKNMKNHKTQKTFNHYIEEDQSKILKRDLEKNSNLKSDNSLLQNDLINKHKTEEILNDDIGKYESKFFKQNLQQSYNIRTDNPPPLSSDIHINKTENISNQNNTINQRNNDSISKSLLKIIPKTESTLNDNIFFKNNENVYTFKYAIFGDKKIMTKNLTFIDMLFIERYLLDADSFHSSRNSKYIEDQQQVNIPIYWKEQIYWFILARAQEIYMNFSERGFIHDVRNDSMPKLYLYNMSDEENKEVFEYKLEYEENILSSHKGLTFTDMAVGINSLETIKSWFGNKDSNDDDMTFENIEKFIYIQNKDQRIVLPYDEIYLSFKKIAQTTKEKVIQAYKDELHEDYNYLSFGVRFYGTI